MPALLAVTAISGLPYNHTSFKPWAPDSRPVTNKNVNPTKQIRSAEFNFIRNRSFNALVKMNRNDRNTKKTPKRIGSTLKRSRSKNRMKSAAQNMLSGVCWMMSEACCMMSEVYCMMSEACYTKTAVCCTKTAVCWMMSAGNCR